MLTVHIQILTRRMFSSILPTKNLTSKAFLYYFFFFVKSFIHDAYYPQWGLMYHNYPTLCRDNKSKTKDTYHVHDNDVHNIITIATNDVPIDMHDGW